FVWCMQQSGQFRSDPFLSPDNRPAVVMAVPLKDINGNFTGMLAAVVSLEPILRRLTDASVRGRTVFVVDHFGHIVAHPDTNNFVPGSDVSSSAVVEKIRALPQELRNTETIHFSQSAKSRSVEMIGTYSTLPEVNGLRIAERSEEHTSELQSRGHLVCR